MKNLKRKKVFYFWAAASLTVMALIFWFSSRNSDESGEMSGSLARTLFEPLLKNWFEPDTIEVIVRKCAHFLIFSALGFCVTNAVRYIISDKKRIFLISLSWCSFYGAADEWHQYFVPGRACMWQDWAIDTAGVLVGIGVSFLTAVILYILHKNRKKTSKRRGLC